MAKVTAKQPKKQATKKVAVRKSIVKKRASKVKKTTKDAVKAVKKTQQTTIRRRVSNPFWLKPYEFKKGVSGNPKGRPPGKSLKTYVREYFESLDEDGKREFLRYVNPEFAWRMAEGNPQQDVTSAGEALFTDENTKQKIKAARSKVTD